MSDEGNGATCRTRSPHHSSLITHYSSLGVMPQTNFELKRKLLQLEALYDVGRALNTLRPEAELLEEMMHRAVAVLDATAGFVFSLDEKLNAHSIYTFDVDATAG